MTAVLQASVIPGLSSDPLWKDPESSRMAKQDGKNIFVLYKLSSRLEDEQVNLGRVGLSSLIPMQSCLHVHFICSDKCCICEKIILMVWNTGPTLPSCTSTYTCTYQYMYAYTYTHRIGLKSDWSRIKINCGIYEESKCSVWLLWKNWLDNGRKSLLVLLIMITVTKRKSFQKEKRKSNIIKFSCIEI